MDTTTTSAPAGLAIRRVPLSSLHLDPANARSHGTENLAAIEGSLRRFTQVEPLVVQKSSGRVVGGNGRLVAMQKLGSYTRNPCGLLTRCRAISTFPPGRTHLSTGLLDCH